MTEEEWRTCTNPMQMLVFLDDSGLLVRRRWRLFGVACCHRVSEFLTSERGQGVVESAERYIDIRATNRIWKAIEVAERHANEEDKENELELAHQEANAAAEDFPGPGEVIAHIDDFNNGPINIYRWTERDLSIEPFAKAAAAAVTLTRREEEFVAWEQQFPEGRQIFKISPTSDGVWDGNGPLTREAAAGLISEYARDIVVKGSKIPDTMELEAQASLIREIFGHPYYPIDFDPEWRTTTALAIARGAYEERAFDRLPILADALQDAGCDNDDILTHLRDTTTPHVRGCWALDLVLGKE